MLNLACRRDHVLDLHRGVGSRIPVGHDEALDAIVDLRHGLHVVGLQQVQRVDGTQSEIGERDCGAAASAAVTGSVQVTVQAM